MENVYFFPMERNIFLRRKRNVRRAVYALIAVVVVGAFLCARVWL